ncbi:hypothetical protein [Chitinophaga sp. Cy-1792]|uniref:hypothetical protein n=1 Tax=Chitinophaga sp. Cy-1792 TaxID=2608339 RepID=UPI00141E7BA1|nr:hypothetical protein [Chitinophaga sp. Cy-1792]NIG56530.1 hypothetical protein [Chitinophaga sp. Cy-1792]
MKYIFLVACVLTVFAAQAQQLPFEFKDRINKFSITIPKNWSYRKPDTLTIAVSARSKEKIDTMPVPDIFNVTVLPIAGMNSEEAFAKMQEQLSQTNNRTIEKGVYTSGRQKLYWADNIIPPFGTFDSVYSAVFVMSNRFRVYVISCTTTAERYKLLKPNFHAIAKSFKCFQQPAPEAFTIHLPDDNVWVATDEVKDPEMGTMYYVHPERENMENYKTAIWFLRSPFPPGLTLKSLVKSFTESKIEENGNMKIVKILETADKAIVSMNDAKTNEYSVACLFKGKTNMHMTTFMTRNRTVSPEEMEKWINILKEGKLVTE